MIHYKTGDLLNDPAEALVNTVNTVGVMGKGIALQFKYFFPHNYSCYRKTCGAGSLVTGTLLPVQDFNALFGNKLIINFPTKQHWRKPSQYAYIEAGLVALRELILSRPVRSIAIPPLGCGNGGLDWSLVRPIIETILADLQAEIYVYEP